MKRRPVKDNQKEEDNEDKSRVEKPKLNRKKSIKDYIASTVKKEEVLESGKIKSVTRRRVFFILGSLLGFSLAYLFASGKATELTDSLPKFPNQWTDYLNQQFDMDSDWRSYLPENTIVEELFGNFTGTLFPNQKTQNNIDHSPATKLKEKGAKSKHPVIIVPGIISTGLESWGLDNCSKKYFRQRLWGTMTMFKSVLTDKPCWIESLKLDPITGLDPPGYRLRAAQGLDAADYFITGYWVWAKIIENLAVLGYDNNNMHLAAYDWRLSYHNLEVRDKYFSKLKVTIEQAVIHGDEKVVALTHSMGGIVWYYFLKWVESENGGKGGNKWVENHVDSTVNIAGAMLGALKTIPSLLSGEQRETVQPMAQYVLEHFFSRQQRAELFRSWGGLWSLLPKGGDIIWGNNTSAPDDFVQSENLADKEAAKSPSFGEVFVFPDNTTVGHNFTVEQSLELLYSTGGTTFAKNLKKSYSFGVATSDKQIRNDDLDAWSNPLETSLPNAPSMKMYCLYGYGLPTERTYYLDETPAVENLDDSQLPYIIDINANQETFSVKSGVRSSLGDGSVPLLSLGYMCVDGWKKKRFNPGQLKVITREFNHTAVPLYEDLRGGPDTGEHIDILGNYKVTEDILKIATGFDTHEVVDKIESDIQEIAKRVQL